MHKLKKVMRFKEELKLSAREIGRALSISHTAVNGYIKQFTESGVDYKTLLQMSDDVVERDIFGKSKEGRYPIPNWQHIHTELPQQGVTLETLHRAYADAHPSGHYGYTWFCNAYKRYTKTLSPSMRQHHKAGEKVFIDFSGKTVDVIDSLTGEAAKAEIFVGALGASGYPFVMAVASQKKADFIAAHIAMFESFGGVPGMLVPDNLKSAVTRSHRYVLASAPSGHRIAHYPATFCRNSDS